MIKNLDSDLQQTILISLERVVNTKVELLDFRNVSGGCINQGGKLTTTQGNYFLKWNDAKRFPDMFKKEALGLALLREPKAAKIPSVIAVGENSRTQFLILEFIETGRPNAMYWNELGKSLAALHKQTSSAFGLDHDNYIGSLPQDNSKNDNWIDFFIQSRINPQLKLAVDNGKLNVSQLRSFECLYKELPSLLPIDRPSLLHGDLWSGNVIVDHAGAAVLIDPAVYYGHREMELAYTQLFGGMESDFYNAYFEAFPVVSGFDNRVDIYNLYPLLVHVNLFGGGYANQVISILNRFI